MQVGTDVVSRCGDVIEPKVQDIRKPTGEQDIVFDPAGLAEALDDIANRLVGAGRSDEDGRFLSEQGTFHPSMGDDCLDQSGFPRTRRTVDGQNFSFLLHDVCMKGNPL